MTAIIFLEQYEIADRRVKRLQEEYDKEMLLIDAVRSVSDNDGMPHGSGISKPTENKAIRLATKAQRLVDAKLEAIRIRQIVFDVINRVDGPGGDFLYKKYIQLKTWNTIAEEMNYSIGGLDYIRDKALIEVELILDSMIFRNELKPIS